MDMEAAIENLDPALEALSERERLVIDRRFGLTGDRATYREIGLGLNLSRERIRQIEARGLRKLRDSLRRSVAGHDVFFSPAMRDHTAAIFARAKTEALTQGKKIAEILARRMGNPEAGR